MSEHPATAASRSPAEILREAAKLIEPEGAWTQRAYARRADGTMRISIGDDVVCFCAIGALAKAAGRRDPTYVEHSEAMFHLQRVTGEPVHVWNDRPYRTQAEVVSALLRAADLAEAS